MLEIKPVRGFRPALRLAAIPVLAIPLVRIVPLTYPITRLIANVHPISFSVDKKNEDEDDDDDVYVSSPFTSVNAEKTNEWIKTTSRTFLCIIPYEVIDSFYVSYIMFVKLFHAMQL